MSQRSLPVSFWTPSQTDQSQHFQGFYNHHGNPIHMLQQNHNPATHYNRSCHLNHRGNYDQNGTSFVRARAIPVSYAQLPRGAVKSFTAGLAPPQVSGPPGRAPVPSFPQDAAVQSTDLQPTSLRFNPRYNSLLVQPDVKPRLPVVPGEPPRTKIQRRSRDMDEFPDELLMRKGEH